MKWINAHEHLESRAQLAILQSAMDQTGIERAVLLGSSAFTITLDPRRGFERYDENNREILQIARNQPGRFEAWPTLNPSDPDSLSKCICYHEQGAKGLKFYTGHGFIAPGASKYFFSQRAIDDPSMDSVYSYCSSNRLPVCLHVNPGREKPGFAHEFVTLLGRYPGLIVNAPHWILSSGSPKRLIELLRSFPNLVTDISFGHDSTLIDGLRRVSRNAATLRELVKNHPQRFLFGTDCVVTSAPKKTSTWMRLRIESYKLMLICETYETELLPGESLQGLALPGEVIKGIAYQNCERLGEPRVPTIPTSPLDWNLMGVAQLQRPIGKRLPPPNSS